MTPIDPTQPSGDPILVLLARMDEKLTNALKSLETQASTLDKHGSEIQSLRDRTTVLEASKPKNVAAWAGVVIAGLAVIAAFAALFVR